VADGAREVEGEYRRPTSDDRRPTKVSSRPDDDKKITASKDEPA
jgi:hypothetical protein